ncbi:terpenoid synthase [Trametes cingulata]|nr:terpenoid synthase [Trametes cingulata]
MVSSAAYGGLQDQGGSEPYKSSLWSAQCYIDHPPPLFLNMVVNGTNNPAYASLLTPACKSAHAIPVTEHVVEEIKRTVRAFLKQLGYRAPRTPENAKLRAEVTAEILSWNADLSSAYVDGLMDTCCTIAESAYAHTSYRHQLAIAIYTTYMVYIDDIGNRDLEVLGQFGRRLLAHEDLGDPVLERLALLLQEMYDLYPRLSAHSIAVATLDSAVGMYVEFTTRDVAVSPGATSYPAYLRTKTGIGSAYALFNFVKGWRDPADSFHLQLVPDIEHYTDSINDILSFYKEALNGDTDNYITLRASAERKHPVVVLQELCEETLESIRRVQALTSSEPRIAEILHRFVMGYVEFHFRAKRYRLAELSVEE